MWSLTEEKIDELIKQMNAKKDEHDALEKKHHFKLWEEDLDAFLESLDQYEEQEERDRLAHGGVKNEGKAKGRKKPVPKKGVDSTASETVKGITNKPKAPKENKEAKEPKEKKPKKVVDPSDLPLRERLALANKTSAFAQEKPDLKIEGKRTLKQADIYEDL